MGLRFFTDHCVPNSIIRVFRDAGYEVLRLADYIPADSIDSVVVSKAQELDAILVSLDADFADIVAYPPAMYSGIIALQVGNHPEVIPRLVVALKDYLSAHPDMNHYDGKLLLVEAHRIRVRE
jgi:predicted nuclease of predicted toxin-antitoxin system